MLVHGLQSGKLFRSQRYRYEETLFFCTLHIIVSVIYLAHQTRYLVNAGLGDAMTQLRGTRVQDLLNWSKWNDANAVSQDAHKGVTSEQQPQQKQIGEAGNAADMCLSIDILRSWMLFLFYKPHPTELVDYAADLLLPAQETPSALLVYLREIMETSSQWWIRRYLRKGPSTMFIGVFDNTAH